MEVCNAKELMERIFPDFDRGKLLLNINKYPKVEYIKTPISDYAMENIHGYNITGCFVWVPKYSKNKIMSRLKFKIKSDSQNCTFIILRTTSSGHQTYVLKGAGSRVLSMSAAAMTFRALLAGTSSLIIGEGTFIGNARIIMKNSDILVGAGGLWSDEIIIQATDQHDIIDLESGNVINGMRNHVSIGRHVWLGRRSVILKNISIGDGSMVGIGALVTKDVPSAVAIGGVPGKVIKKSVTWIDNSESIKGSEKIDIKNIRKSLRRETPKTKPERYISIIKNILKTLRSFFLAKIK